MVGIMPALGQEYACIGAPVRLPTGASLQAVRVFMNNTYDTNPSMGLWKYHQYFSVPENLVGMSGGTPGAGVQYVDYFLPTAETISNENVYYLLAMLYRDTVKTEQFHQIYGIQLWYQLQVSPAPSIASFNDVSTSHPFFKWIEALKGSGLTAGCGGGNFCPDSPVTRGQMAVFLSKALGLNWPY
jgi:S-layer homology domain